MRELHLTRGMVAMVDEIDYERAILHKWYAHKGKRTWYARMHVQRDGVITRVYLHRFVAGLTIDDSEKVDHRDHNGLNCTRSNLRVCSQANNLKNTRKRHGFNSSQYKGVSWDGERGTWKAKIVHRRQQIFLGRFDAEDDAARAYDKAAIDRFGEFATLNFPLSVGNVAHHSQHQPTSEGVPF